MPRASGASPELGASAPLAARLTGFAAREAPPGETGPAGSVVFAWMGAVETQVEQAESAAVVHEATHAKVRSYGSAALADLDAPGSQAAEWSAEAQSGGTAAIAELCVVVRPGARTAGSVEPEGCLDGAARRAAADVHRGVPS